MQSVGITVSVVIPVWNRCETVIAAIDSVLDQREFVGALDIVVVDDGSTDDLASTLAPYGMRVRCVRHATNRGAAAARNTGVAASRGDYVALLDSDDVWLPGKLATQVNFMVQNGLAISTTSYILRHNNGVETLSPWYCKPVLGIADLVWGCFVSPGSTMIFKRPVFEEVGPLLVDLKRLEDWEWLLRAVARYPLGFLQQPLAMIWPSRSKGSADILAALDRIGHDHLPELPPRQRRHLRAAIRFERAAYFFRNGHLIPMVTNLLGSMSLAPLDHQALKAALYNRRMSPVRKVSN
jgi:glycosyltransferase involved in cell wall biosynthesis